MKLLRYFLLVLCSLPLAVLAQEINKTTFDEKSQKDILIGLCTQDGLTTGDFGQFYQTEFGTYKPDYTITEKLKTKLSNLTIVIVMATWCGDSKEQIPRFFKVIDKIGFDKKNSTIYCVDRDKKTPKGETEKYNVTLVPTILFYKNELEIGRITEAPKLTLESDMLNILNK